MGVVKALKGLTALILGPPGGGKGTISKKLLKDFGFLHLSTGDVLRKHVREQTAVGMAAQKFMLTGALVPDKVMVDLVVEELASKGHVPRLLLDGFPRTIPQAIALEQHVKIDMVIDLEIPDQTIIERISNRWIHAPSGRTYAYDYNPPKVEGVDDVTGEKLVQREDDEAETVKARLDQYKKVTSPLVDHYKYAGNLATFAGTESDIIYPKVKAYLTAFLDKRS